MKESEEELMEEHIPIGPPVGSKWRGGSGSRYEGETWTIKKGELVWVADGWFVPVSNEGYLPHTGRLRLSLLDPKMGMRRI